MEVKLAQDHHRREYRVTFEEGELEPRPVPYTRTERTYAPMVATVQLLRSNGKRWNLYSLELTGRAHKKDGTVGLEDVTEHFYNSDRGKQPKPLTDAVESILGSLDKD